MERPFREVFAQQFTATVTALSQHFPASREKSVAIFDKPQRCQLFQQRGAEVQRIASLSERRDGA